jgi:hypothetical protein
MTPAPITIEFIICASRASWPSRLVSGSGAAQPIEIRTPTNTGLLARSARASRGLLPTAITAAAVFSRSRLRKTAFSPEGTNDRLLRSAAIRFELSARAQCSRWVALRLSTCAAAHQGIAAAGPAKVNLISDQAPGWVGCGADTFLAPAGITARTPRERSAVFTVRERR